MGKRRAITILLSLAGPPLLLGAGLAARGQFQVPTTLTDFFLPGSQPSAEGLYESFRPSHNCANCHDFDKKKATELAIYAPWRGSMMAQAARDPLFYACLAIANQDAESAGDLCIRCHTPGGWLAGRSSPSDGSKLNATDRDGVSCSVCHRMVDPVFKPEVSPPADEFILANLLAVPQQPGGGNYVMDPQDIRRGPREDPINLGHTFLPSPFHSTSELCATCHDVSNPLYRRQPDGTYAMTPLDAAHDSGEKHEMFPLERTYSEWLLSDFARYGVNMQGRFGGSNRTIVRTCQDCHMPTVAGRGADLGRERVDVASHDFAGGNAWAQDMILNLYPDDGLEAPYLHAGKQRSVEMLQRAATLEARQAGRFVRVRITNETGHKLPTGYPEGRRMWINVQVFDDVLETIDEFGRYDPLTAELTGDDTTVYEAVLGIDTAVAAVTGLPAGHSFHFALNNVILKDNRIPPRGYAFAEFHQAQAAPVAAGYADGQFWDETMFRLPSEARLVTVNVYYQTASKEYITFLRDENRTNDTGDVLYDQWELTGKSPPVLMAAKTIFIGPQPSGDGNADERIDNYDWNLLTGCGLFSGDVFDTAQCGMFDFDDDRDLDLRDASEFQLSFAP